MAWVDGLDSSAGKTSTLTAGQQTYYDKIFLDNAAYRLHMMQFGIKKTIPESSGKTIQFTRYNEIAARTTKLTEGTNPAGTLIGDHKITRTLEEWGDWTQNTSLNTRVYLDPHLAGLSKLWGNQAGRTIDKRIMAEVVTLGSHSISADTDAAACGAGMRPGQWACSECGSTASTTTILYCETAVNDGDLVFDDTNDWFIGGLLTGTSGKNMGASRFVYDSISATKSMYVYPNWEAAPAANDTFIFSHPGLVTSTAETIHALDAADTLTHKVFALTLEDLQTYEAPPYDGDYYIFLIGPTTNRGFMTDTDGGWMGLAQYRGQQLYRGEIGKYMGFRVVQTSKPFRCALPVHAITGGPGATSASDYSLTGTNYAVNGAGHYSLAFGRGAYAVTLLPGSKKPKIIVHAAGAAGSADPLNMQSSIGWYMPFTPCALNATWCVSVVSGG